MGLRYVTIEEYQLKEPGYTAEQFYRIRGTTIQEDYEEVQRRKAQLKKDTLFAGLSSSELHKAWERKKEEEKRREDKIRADHLLEECCIFPLCALLSLQKRKKEGKLKRSKRTFSLA